MAITEKFDGEDRIEFRAWRALDSSFCESYCELRRPHDSSSKNEHGHSVRHRTNRGAGLERRGAIALGARLCRYSPVLSPAECAEITALYNDASRFRSHIIMERYRFGIGDYKYFANPLPELVAELRSSAYPHLAVVANLCAEAFGERTSPYPQ